MLVREGNKVSSTQKVCEAEKTQKVHILVNPKNSNPLLLQNHLWFFDPKLSSNISEFNKSFSDKGLSISQLPVDTGDFDGNVLDVVAKDEKNMVVDTVKDFTSLVSFLNKNIQSLTKTKKDVPKSDVQKQVDKAQEPKEKAKKGLAFTMKWKSKDEVSKELKKKNMQYINNKNNTKNKEILFYGVNEDWPYNSDGTWNIGGGENFYFFYDESSAEKKYNDIEYPSQNGKYLAKLNTSPEAKYFWVISLNK